jgi:putative oxidoreductase
MSLRTTLEGIFQRRDFGLLLLRLGMGGFFLAHGWGKIVGGPETWQRLGGAMRHIGLTQETVQQLFGLAGTLAEFLGGLLLIVGFYTRTAAFFLFCTMIVAALEVNSRGGDFLMTTARPLELAVVFLALMFMGSGRYALKPGSAG